MPVHSTFRTLLLLSAALPGAAFAQSTDTRPSRPASASPIKEPASADDIVVTGARLQAVQEIAAKHEIAVIADSVSADEAGTLPDFGLGEALDRVPGLSTIQNNDRGESQFVSIRGLNADYNLVEIDGIVLPANEIGRRNVSLDVMPSSLARRVEVYKSVTPAMNGNSIGGTVNLRSRSAFDRADGLFIGGRADFGTWENERVRHDWKPSGQAELVVSDTFGPDRKFGFVVSGSYYRRDSASLNSAIDSYNYFNPTTGARLDPLTTDVSDANAAPARRRWLHYDNVRARRGGFAKLEYKDDVFRGALTGAYFLHTNDEERQSNIAVANGNPVASSITATSGRQTSGNSQVDLVEYGQSRSIWWGAASGEWTPGNNVHADLVVNYAEATYHQDARLATYRIANTNQLAYSYDLAPGGFTQFNFDNPSYVANPANYSQFEYGTTTDDNVERTLTTKANLGYNAESGDYGLGVQGGAFVRFLDRQYDYGVANYRPAAGTSFRLSDVYAGALYAPYNGGGQSMLFVDPRAAQSFFEKNATRFTATSTNAGGSLASDYGLTEDIYAGYLLARYATDQLTLIGGVRYERTDVSTNSLSLRSGTYSPISASQHYDNWLPSAQATFDVTQAFRIRAAASRTIGRPNYDDLAERSAVSINSSTGAVTITSGNPGLRARQSTNYDLSLEYYWGKALFSAAFFYKDITDDILTVRNSSDEVFDGVLQPINRVRPQNTDSIKIKGLELNMVVPRLQFLPQPLDGLGFSANLTLLDPNPPSITMSDGVTRRQLSGLFESANTIANARLFYTIGPVTVQGAWNHRSAVLYSVSTTDPLQDRQVAPSNTFDAQIRIKAMKEITLIGQARNLTNERPRRLTGPDFSLLREELDNGRAYYVGVAFKF